MPYLMKIVFRKYSYVFYQKCVCYGSSITIKFSITMVLQCVEFRNIKFLSYMLRKVSSLLKHPVILSKTINKLS